MAKASESTALVPDQMGAPPARVAQPAPIQVARELSVDDVLAQADKIQDIMQRGMKVGLHYGTIPGTKKPSLLQPGAEKLCLLFRFAPQYQSEREYDAEATKDWKRWNKYKKVEESGTCKSYIRWTVNCTLIHGPTGVLISSGLGTCNNWESKYVTRDGHDIDETICQMARKRALVNAVRTATAASDLFTQDEDLIQSGGGTGQRRGQGQRREPKTPSSDSDPSHGGPAPLCPDCKGPMWDNSADRAKDKAAVEAGTRKAKPRPAFKCKDRDCKGTIWSSSGSDEKPPAKNPRVPPEAEALKAKLAAEFETDLDTALPATEHQKARIMELCKAAGMTGDTEEGREAQRAFFERHGVTGWKAMTQPQADAMIRELEAM